MLNGVVISVTWKLGLVVLVYTTNCALSWFKLFRCLVNCWCLGKFGLVREPLFGGAFGYANLARAQTSIPVFCLVAGTLAASIHLAPLHLASALFDVCILLVYLQ